VDHGELVEGVPLEEDEVAGEDAVAGAGGDGVRPGPPEMRFVPVPPSIQLSPPYWTSVERAFARRRRSFGTTTSRETGRKTV